MQTTTARTPRPAASRTSGLALRPARRPFRLAARSTEPEQSAGAAVATSEPVIAVQFQEEGGVTAAVDVVSGDQLRAVMLDAKVDLYTTWGKIWSCGGAGQCGTCIVQVRARAWLSTAGVGMRAESTVGAGGLRAL